PLESRGRKFPTSRAGVKRCRMPFTVPSLQDALITLTGDEVPADALVLQYSTHETLSAPYTLIVEFATKEQFSLEQATGTQFMLTVPGEGGFRQYRGDLWEGAFVRNVGDKLHFSLTLKPKLAWLSARENTRIYQEFTIPQILESILEEANLTASTDVVLSATYEKREFVVQYRESTLNFFQRLCEEVGIFYYFT